MRASSFSLLWAKGNFKFFHVVVVVAFSTSFRHKKSETTLIKLRPSILRDVVSGGGSSSAFLSFSKSSRGYQHANFMPPWFHDDFLFHLERIFLDFRSIRGGIRSCEWMEIDFSTSQPFQMWGGNRNQPPHNNIHLFHRHAVYEKLLFVHKLLFLLLLFLLASQGKDYKISQSWIESVWYIEQVSLS